MHTQNAGNSLSVLFCEKLYFKNYWFSNTDCHVVIAILLWYWVSKFIIQIFRCGGDVWSKLVLIFEALCWGMINTCYINFWGVMVMHGPTLLILIFGALCWGMINTCYINYNRCCNMKKCWNTATIGSSIATKASVYATIGSRYQWPRC